MRYRPNAFNNLHLIEKKIKSDPTADWEQWLNGLTQGSLSTVYGSTRSEAKATIVLFKHMDKACRKFYATAVAQYGMVRGPFPHAFFSAPSVQEGYSPAGDAVIGYDMMNKQSTTLLIAQRCLSYWTEAPAGLRKNASADVSCDMQKVCRAFEITLEHYKSMLPGKHASEDAKLATAMFMTGSHDLLYLDIATDKPLPKEDAVMKIPEMSSNLKKHQADVDIIDAEKRQHYLDKVHTATFEQLKADLQADEWLIQHFFHDLKTSRFKWGDRLLTFKRQRRGKGLASADKYLSMFLKVIVSEHTSDGIVEIANMKQVQADNYVDSSGKSMYLHIVDLSHPGILTECKEMFKTAAQGCDQGLDHSTLFIYPVRYTSQDTTSYLKLVRDLEDAAIKSGFDFSQELSLHYELEEGHGSDNRAQFGRARLMTSSKITGNSPWMNIDALNKHGGRIQGLPLSRVKNLIIEKMPESGPYDVRPDQVERATHRGPPAFAGLVKNLINGLGMTRKDRIFCIDYNAGGSAGEKGDGVFMLQQEVKNNMDIILPNVSLVVIIVAKTDDHKAVTLKKNIIDRLTAKYLKAWESSSEAGPADPIDGPDSAVIKPALHLYTWNDADVVLPDVIVNKFDSSSSVAADWKTCTDTSIAQIKMWQRASGASTAPPPGSKTDVERLLTSPDMSTEPFPLNLQRTLELEHVEEVDFPVIDVYPG